MWIAINNDGTPALTPYKLKTSTSYTDVDTYSLEKGGTCNLGSTDAPWNAVYAKNYYDEHGNKISTGGGSISLKIDGATRSSGFTNYNLATQDWVTGKGYLTQHQSLYGYATTSWVSNNFAPKGSGGGTTYYAGSGISISGTTISVDYNDLYVRKIYHSSDTSYYAGVACLYCYQGHKGKNRMSFETAKKFFDLVVSGEKGFKSYINPEKSPGLVVDFIGGEPFLEIELIDQICTYIMDKLIELDHPWAMKTMFSICSNGVLYRDEKVQAFLRKWANRLSFSVTIDGNKELHDSCRVFPDGGPSYDIAVDAASDWMKRGNHMGSKITIAPGNISFLYDAIKHMVDLGYDEINANCVYEKGWTPVHATVLYDQMKRISDYFLEQNFDFERDFFCSLYNEDFFQPKDPDDLQSWCGGVGNSMIACDPQGRIFPCIRYMESSLNGEQEPYSIGDVDNGIGCTECYKCRINCMAKIDRRTQSTDECFYCPIAAGCSNCSGYDYQVNGTPDSKATYICVMHKARALGNLYFWNKYYRKNNMSKRMKNYVPDEWALEIISESELNMLKELERED